MVPEGVTETASEHPAAQGMHVPGDNRESRENRERSRRCDTALSFATDGDPDGQDNGHCCALIEQWEGRLSGGEARRPAGCRQSVSD
jgi:hypothetical protein